MAEAKKHYLYFDYLKFFLIFFVVFGHMIEKYIENPVMRAIYFFIYSFHMPVFIFISGMFAKYDKKRCLRYLLIYFIFQIIHQILNIFFISPKEIYTFVDILGMFFTPAWTLWFLPAMAVWIFSLKFVKNISFKLIFLLILLSLILGFVPFIGGALTLGRIIYFYPIFLLGKKLGGENLRDFLEKIRKIQKPIIFFVAGIGLLCLFILFYFVSPHLNINFFYGRDCYENIFGLPLRMLAYILSFFASAMFILLVPVNIKKDAGGGFASCIGQRTLAIYLFHPIILLFVIKFLDLSSLHFILILLILFVLSLLITLFTSLPIFRAIIEKVKFDRRC